MFGMETVFLILPSLFYPLDSEQRGIETSCLMMILMTIMTTTAKTTTIKTTGQAFTAKKTKTSKKKLLGGRVGWDLL